MTSLPLADAETRAHFVAMMHAYTAHTNTRDFAAARELFEHVHADVLVFGLHHDIEHGREALAAHLEDLWAKEHFEKFDDEDAQVLMSADGTMAVVVSTFSTTGYHQDGEEFDRDGRTTSVHSKTSEGWRLVHIHSSLNAGVPHVSHPKP